jgi:integrase
MLSRKTWGANQIVLNVRKLEALLPSPGQERTEYWDVSLPGFGVRVAASGRKTFTVRYSLHGKQLRKDIGIYGVTKTLADARGEAARIITEAKNGRDPLLSTAIMKRAGIADFRDLAERFVEERFPELREATRKEMKRVIDKELLPVWGERDPNSVQPEEVDIWARTVGKRAPYVANRCFEYMRLIYNFGIKRRLLSYTPLVGLEKPHREEVRTRTLTEEEIRRIFEALEEEPKQMAGMWLLLFYTGSRLRETLKAEWAWVQESERYMVLPKTATKNKREHLVPLIAEATEVLGHLRALAGESPYIFPGPKGTPMHWAQRSAERVWVRARIDDVRIHDIRRTVSTALAKLGISENIIDRTLNHTQVGQKLARTYNTYQYIPEKRAALTKWAKRLRTIIGRDPNRVMKVPRSGYQGKGVARRLRRSETWEQRRMRLAAAGRDLVREHREQQQRLRESARVSASSSIQGDSPSRAVGVALSVEESATLHEPD